MSIESPVFTVFTPAYNRAHTLHRVYESLSSQSFRDFEWLVVDDGSVDNTGELVRRWAAEADFPIRYIPKENGGKHTATNKGVAEAAGAFFLTLDSDDECVPEALERLLFHWNTIPEEDRDRFSAVSVLCKTPDGTIDGSFFPASPFDSDSIESHSRYGVTGEKWGFQRTDVMRGFPFPEFPGELFIPEGIVWNRIARHYKTRYVNEALRIYHPEGDSLSSSMLRIRAESPRGTSLYYRELSEVPFAGLLFRLKALINYIRFSRHAGTGIRGMVTASARPVLTFCLLTTGCLFYLRDRRSL